MIPVLLAEEEVGVAETAALELELAAMWVGVFDTVTQSVAIPDEELPGASVVEVEDVVDVVDVEEVVEVVEREVLVEVVEVLVDVVDVDEALAIVKLRVLPGSIGINEGVGCVKTEVEWLVNWLSMDWKKFVVVGAAVVVAVLVGNIAVGLKRGFFF